MIYRIQWQHRVCIYDLRFITSISLAFFEVQSQMQRISDNSVQISHTLNVKLIIGWRLLFGVCLAVMNSEYKELKTQQKNRK